MAGTLVLFMDDARADAFDFMPTVRRLMRRGTTFTKAYAPSPVCRPARAGLMMGQYAQRVGIFDNSEGNIEGAISAGTFSHFALPKWLSDEGVLTGVCGKYGISGGGGPPVGAWDRAACITGDAQRHTDYGFVNEAGVEVTTPQWHSDMQTDFIKSVIDQANGDDWFTLWSSTSPHWPFAGYPKNPLTHAGYPYKIPPQEGVNWPPWISGREPVTDKSVAASIYRNQIAELRDLDDHLAMILDHLGDDLDETTIIVTSDNGLHLGDHRFLGPGTKNTAYEWACHIPMVAAGPGFPMGRTVDAPVVVPDVTATAVTQYGATATKPPDGVDLRLIANDPFNYQDRAVLIQIRLGVGTPFIDAVVTKEWKLMHHTASPDVPTVTPQWEWEAYNIQDDPEELVNVYDTMDSAIKDNLKSRLNQLLLG